MSSHDVKAGVAESGDGVEDGHPYPGQAEVNAECRHHEYGADKFHGESESEYERSHFHNAADLIRGDGLHKQTPLKERDFSS